jgi:phytoene dehydrogenase-like protein
MGGLTQALARAAEAYGATVRVAAPVDRILVKDGRATGVVLESGEEILACAIASNADPKGTFLRLVGPEHLPADFVRAVGRIAMEGVSMADRVVEVLAEYAPNITRAILRRHILTPADLEAEYGMTGGNIFHGEMSLGQLFFLRPLAGWAKYRTPIRDLYLCGSGTHPGGGVTEAPGRNAAREILADWRRRRMR